MEALQNSLKTATFKVMETMFYLLPDDEVPVGRSVYIGITGSPAYLITLTFNENLARHMAQVLLKPCDDFLEERLVNQCLAETANIIGGNLLHTFGNSDSRNLTLPSGCKRDIFPGMVVEESSGLTMTFEGEPVHVIIETVRGKH